MPTKPKEQSEPPPMSDLHAMLGGAAAGAIAPLAGVGVNKFDVNATFTFWEIPWVNMLVFGIIGATVVYFLAERTRRHVFTYGVVAPFLVLGTVSSFRAEQAVKEKTQAEKATEQSNETAATATQAALAAEANQKKTGEARATQPKSDLGSEAIEAVLTSEQPSL